MLQRRSLIRLLLGLLIAVLVITLVTLRLNQQDPAPVISGELIPTPAPAVGPTPETPPPAAVQREFELQEGQALITALREQGIEASQATGVALALEAVYDVRKLRAGQQFSLALEPNAESIELQSLSFKTGRDRQIVVDASDSGYVAAEREIPHRRIVRTGSLVVQDSLGAAAADAGVPQEVILEIVQQLGHKIDFKRDLRAGDRIDLTYEHFIHADGVEHVGGLLSARLRLANADPMEIYRHTTDDGIISFFDEDGASIETEFARTPVVGGYLTSSYGPRRHPILNISRMHKGMDFAADKGAAIIAVRAGTVTRANRNGSFGNYIRINHGDSIATAYAHLSGFRDGIKKGARVKQGEIIGYVGESGLATSPSLHYEVLRNGRQVDPRSFDLPPRMRLKNAELARFRQNQQSLRAALDQKNQDKRAFDAVIESAGGPGRDQG